MLVQSPLACFQHLFESYQKELACEHLLSYACAVATASNQSEGAFL